MTNSRIRKATLAVLLCLLLAPVNSFAGGYDYDIGIRARALGGAFRAIADDWTAIAYNPAGMAFALDNQLGVSSGFHHNRFSITPNYYYSGSFGVPAPETGYLNGQEVPNHNEIGWTPEAGMIFRLPVWGEMTFGLGVYQTHDADTDWMLFKGVDGYDNTLMFDPSMRQFTMDLDIVRFQASAARLFNDDKLAIGISIAAVRADLIHHNITLRDHPLSGIPAPDNKIPEYTAADGNGWGIGAEIGLLWKATEKLNVAATFRPKTTVTVSGPVDFEFYMPVNEGYAEEQGYLPNSEGDFMTSGFKLVTESDFDVDVVSPTSFAAGIAYKFSDKVTISIDGEYTLWSQYEGLNFSYDQSQFKLNVFSAVPPPLMTALAKKNLSFPAVWDDAGRAMMGIEYRHREWVSLLGGLQLDQTVISESTATPQFIDNGLKWGASVGASFSVNRWEVQFMTSYYHHPELEVKQPRDVNSDGITDNVPATIMGDTYRTAMGFAYRF